MIDWALQMTSEKKQVEIIGSSTAELVQDADAKRIFSRRAIVAANKVLEISKSGSSGRFPSEEEFLSALNKFRLEAAL
jgi:hypothetical protein